MLWIRSAAGVTRRVTYLLHTTYLWGSRMLWTRSAAGVTRRVTYLLHTTYLWGSRMLWIRWAAGVTRWVTYLLHTTYLWGSRMLWIRWAAGVTEVGDIPVTHHVSLGFTHVVNQVGCRGDEEGGPEAEEEVAAVGLLGRPGPGSRPPAGPGSLLSCP